MTAPCCAVHLAEIARLDGELAKVREMFTLEETAHLKTLAERDEERSMHERLSAEYHATARKVTASLAEQIRALTEALKDPVRNPECYLCSSCRGTWLCDRHRRAGFEQIQRVEAEEDARTARKERDVLRAERDALAEDLRSSATYHDSVCIANDRKLRAEVERLKVRDELLCALVDKLRDLLAHPMNFATAREDADAIITRIDHSMDALP